MGIRHAAVVVVVGVAAATLVGCAGQAAPASQPSATPTSTEPASAASCEEFSGLTEQMATNIVDSWQNVATAAQESELERAPEQFDMLALETDGTVGERMMTVADLLQETTPIVMSLNPDDYFDAISAVQRACAADGVTIGVATWNSGS